VPITSIACPNESKKSVENIYGIRKDSSAAVAVTAAIREKEKITCKLFSKEKHIQNNINNNIIYKNVNNKIVKKQENGKEKERALIDNNSKENNNNKNENSQSVKDFKKTISLNTQLSNFTSNNNSYSNNTKKNLISPTNKNKFSYEINTANEATVLAASFGKNLISNKNRNIINNNENFGESSYPESKTNQSKNIYLNKIIDYNNNHESLFANDAINYMPQSTKNKLKISINKSYVKSPVNTELRSAINVFGQAKGNKNNNPNGKVHSRGLELNTNNAEKSSLIGDKADTITYNYHNTSNNDCNVKNARNTITEYSRNEEPFIFKNLKDVKEKTPSFVANNRKILKNEIYTNNNNEDICNKNTLIVKNEIYSNNNENENYYLPQVKNCDNSDNEKDLEEELNKLELYPNINVLEYIANKLVEKSISNLETSMKTSKFIYIPLPFLLEKIY